MNSAASAGATERRVSDQSAVWSDIDQKMSRMKGHSPTHAMSDMFEHHAPAIESYVQAFPPVPNQSGAALLINGLLIGMDVFDTAEAFTKLFHKLIRSYALDAIDDAAAATQLERIVG